MGEDLLSSGGMLEPVKGAALPDDRLARTSVPERLLRVLEADDGGATTEGLDPDRQSSTDLADRPIRFWLLRRGCCALIRLCLSSLVSITHDMGSHALE